MSEKKYQVFLALIFFSVLIYSGVHDHQFLSDWDDADYVTENVLAHGFSLDHVRGAFSGFFVGNYAPLHIISYMLDYTLWGLRPSGYLLENVLLHGCNGFLLYLLVRRLSGTGGGAFLAALLFVAHPVQVEAVAWVSQRKSVLAMLFFLLASYWYVMFSSATGGRRRLFYLLSVAAFAAALLTKSTAVILPAILLLYDACFERCLFRESLRNMIPYGIAAGVAALLALSSQSPEYGGGMVGFHGGSLSATVITMLPVYVTYLRLLVWPSGLSVVYAPQVRTSVDLPVLGAALLLLSLAAAAVWLFKRDRKLFFWLAIIPIGILPVCQIIPLVTLINDRYLYFPMVGVAPFAVLGGCRLLERHFPDYRRAGLALTLVLLVVFGVVTGKRVTVWRNSSALWEDAVAKQPHSFMANYVLALVRVKSGQLDAARPLLEKLRRMDPENAKLDELSGHLHYMAGDLRQAEADYLRALARSPWRHKSQLYLGNIYLSQGRLGEALDRFRTAEKLKPFLPDTAYSIACAEAQLHHPAASLAALSRAFGLGFRDCAAIAANPELDPVRGLPEFETLMSGYCGAGVKR